MKAFVTRAGLFEYLSMPMGLMGATAMFQRLMELAMTGLQWNSCLIFVDALIVFGRNFEEHLTRLATTLGRTAKGRPEVKTQEMPLLQEWG